MPCKTLHARERVADTLCRHPHTGSGLHLHHNGVATCNREENHASAALSWPWLCTADAWYLARENGILSMLWHSFS